MNGYAECVRGTGAMPCARASVQVIRPFPLSSHRSSAEAVRRAGTDLEVVEAADGLQKTILERLYRYASRCCLPPMVQTGPTRETTLDNTLTFIRPDHD